MYSVQPDDRIDGFQVSLTPRLQLRKQLVGDSIDGTIGKLDTVEIGNMAADVLVTVTQGKQSQDLAFQFIGEVSLVLLDQLGFEGARPGSGGIQLNAASGAFYGLGRLSVLTVRRFLVGQVFIQLGLHAGL